MVRLDLWKLRAKMELGDRFGILAIWIHNKKDGNDFANSSTNSTVKKYI